MKAYEDEVEAGLALKADKSGSYVKVEVDGFFNSKANVTDVKSSLALKTDKNYTDTNLNLKANITDVNSSLALKTDVATTNAIETALTEKADKTTTYTKTLIDGFLNDKANLLEVEK